MSGRGAYFKYLYGGGGRGGHGGGGTSRGGFAAGGGRGGGAQAQHSREDGGDYKRTRVDSSGGRTTSDLHQALLSRDGRPYPAYRDIGGSWSHNSPSLAYIFDLLHVQADPFAPPSKARVRLTKEQTGFPQNLWDSRIKRTALSHYLLQAFHTALGQQSSESPPSGGGGYNNKMHRPEIVVDTPTNQVLERTAVSISSEGDLEIRLQVALPARGRSILAPAASHLLTNTLPYLVSQTLLAASHSLPTVSSFVQSIVQQSHLRSLLPSQDLVAFIPFGAILPRRSGASGEQGPLVGPGVKVFGEKGLTSERVYEFDLGDGKSIRGMGIRKGEVVVICGGGFHGKSTLLDAINEGGYDHVPGDGREFVVSCPSITQVRSEDGRSVSEVDISPFITNLPGGSDTTRFSTEDASGSTSCAASLVEALDSGCELVCLDEDTCATNFLIRDARMQMLVSAELEPITPLVHKIRALVQERGTTMVLVVGGCGDYLDVADVVLQMDNYEIRDVTERAKEVALKIPSTVPDHQATSFPSSHARSLVPSSLAPPPSSDARVKTLNLTSIQHTSLLDLSALTSLVSVSQTRSLELILRSGPSWGSGEVMLSEWVGKVEEMLAREGGLDELAALVESDGRGVANEMLARPRRVEVEMAVNRLRSAVLRRARV